MRFRKLVEEKTYENAQARTRRVLDEQRWFQDRELERELTFLGYMDPNYPEMDLDDALGRYLRDQYPDWHM